MLRLNINSARKAMLEKVDTIKKFRLNYDFHINNRNLIIEANSEDEAEEIYEKMIDELDKVFFETMIDEVDRENPHIHFALGEVEEI